MVSAKDIQATCADIVREFSPLQVILFGSYAYGAPTEDFRCRSTRRHGGTDIGDAPARISNSGTDS